MTKDMDHIFRNPQLEPLKLPGVDKHGFGSMNIDHLISTAFKPKT